MDLTAALDAAERDAAVVVDLKLIDIDARKIRERRLEAQLAAVAQGALVLDRCNAV